MKQRLSLRAEGVARTIRSGVFDSSFPESKTRRGRVQGGGSLAPTIVASNSDNICRIERPKQLGYIDNGTGQRQSNAVYDTDAISPAVTTIGAGGTQQIKIEARYRIRKLTPKECFRLMGFTDDEFGRASEVNSNSQLYKEAGNSIVVDVLEAIFYNLFVNEDTVVDNGHAEAEEIEKREQLNQCEAETGQTSIFDFMAQ